MPMPDFEIRPLKTLDDFHAAEAVQRAVWDSADLDIVPLHIMLTIARNGGIVLGAFEGIVLEEQRLDLAPGDTLILYTDGVTEALNGEGEAFGEDRLAAVIAASLGSSADETIGAICGALAAFTGGAEPADDVTVVRRG